LSAALGSRRVKARPKLKKPLLFPLPEGLLRMFR
jgi:hypothetical protein